MGSIFYERVGGGGTQDSGCLAEVAELRAMFDRRYDEIKSGRVKLIDGEAFFESLRQRE